MDVGGDSTNRDVEFFGVGCSFSWERRMNVICVCVCVWRDGTIVKRRGVCRIRIRRLFVSMGKCACVLEGYMEG